MTLTLQATADRPAPAWTVSVIDLDHHQGRGRCLDVVLDRSTVARGQTASLTISARGPIPDRRCIVGIVSRLGADAYLWPVFVVVDG